MISLLQHRREESQTERLSLESKLKALKEQLETAEKQNSELKCTNVKLMSEVRDLTRNETTLTNELKSVKRQFKLSEEQLKAVESKLTVATKEFTSEVSSYQTKLQEQSSMLKEYQERVSNAVTADMEQRVILQPTRTGHKFSTYASSQY